MPPPCRPPSSWAAASSAPPRTGPSSPWTRTTPPPGETRGGAGRDGGRSAQLGDVADGAAVGARGHRGVGAQGRGDLAVTVLRRVHAVQRLASGGELLVGDEQLDRTVRDVDPDPVAVLDQRDRAAGRRLGRGVPDGEAGGAAGEPAVRDERAGLAETAALQEGRRVEHLLHAGAAARALVADDDDVAVLDLLAEDLVDGVLLRLADDGRSLEGPDRLVDARRLHDAAVHGEVPLEDRQTAVLGVRVRHVADAAAGRVQV